MSRRVVVTGIGMITPLGSGRDWVWRCLIAGESGIGPITAFDASSLQCRIAGQVPEEAWPSDAPTADRRNERFVRFARVAAEMALGDAGLAAAGLDPDRTGVIVGTAYGGIARIESESQLVASHGARWVSPHASVTATPTAAAASLSLTFGITGHVECVSAACASGAVAISRAFECIKRDDVDLVIAGGTDAAITESCVAGFNAARALSTRNDAPSAACRPFDLNRDGFVFGEGACVLILEERDAAMARGAHILAELLGRGQSAEAFSLSAPEPSGAGLFRSMRSALACAGLSPSDIDYVNAHAAGTAVGDIAEAQAIRRLFGPGRPRISSTKSMTGHLLGAAGALEAAVTVLTLANQVIPPNINVSELDPQCDLDVVANESSPSRVEVAISNSVGLGGVTCTLALARP